MGLIAPRAAHAATGPVVYGFGSLSQVDGGTLVTTDGDEGGIVLRATLPAGDYRLVVDGQTIDGGGFLLRTETNGVGHYFSSPTGADSHRLSTRGGAVEALIYSDSPGAYLVRSIAFEPCTAQTCRTDDDLKAQVLAETPGLQTALDTADRSKVVDLLLAWTAPRVPFYSTGSTGLDTTDRSAAEIYYDFWADARRGVACGGAAQFFHELLTLFGVDSFTVDFGVEGVVTHVTDVVTIDGSYRIVDPTFGLRFVLPGSNREPSVAELFDIDAAALADQLKVRAVSLGARPILLHGEDGKPRVVTTCATAGSAYSACSWDTFAAEHAAALGGARYPGALVTLLRTETLFAPAAHDNPDDFLAMRAAASDDELPLPLPPVAIAPPVVDGAAEVGAKLTATTGTWHARTQADQVAGHWVSCTARGCKRVSDSTLDCTGRSCRNVDDSRAYTLQAGDAGATVYYTVVAANTYGRSVPARSAAVAIAAPAPPAVSDPLPSLAQPPVTGPPAAPATGTPPAPGNADTPADTPTSPSSADAPADEPTSPGSADPPTPASPAAAVAPELQTPAAQPTPPAATLKPTVQRCGVSVSARSLRGGLLTLLVRNAATAVTGTVTVHSGPSRRFRLAAGARTNVRLPLAKPRARRLSVRVVASCPNGVRSARTVTFRVPTHR